jgi:hypothetical protein
MIIVKTGAGGNCCFLAACSHMPENENFLHFSLKFLIKHLIIQLDNYGFIVARFYKGTNILMDSDDPFFNL